MLLLTSAAALFLLCFVNSFGFFKGQSTARSSESEIGLVRACLRSCGSPANELERPTKSNLDTTEVRDNERSVILCSKGCGVCVFITDRLL